MTFLLSEVLCLERGHCMLPGWPPGCYAGLRFGPVHKIAPLHLKLDFGAWGEVDLTRGGGACLSAGRAWGARSGAWSTWWRDGGWGGWCRDNSLDFLFTPIPWGVGEFNRHCWQVWDLESRIRGWFQLWLLDPMTSVADSTMGAAPPSSISSTSTASSAASSLATASWYCWHTLGPLWFHFIGLANAVHLLCVRGAH